MIHVSKAVCWLAILPLEVIWGFLIAIQNVSGGKVNILGGHSVCRSRQEKYMCLIPNGFQDRAFFTVNYFGFGVQYCPSFLPYCATGMKCQLAIVTVISRYTQRSNMSYPHDLQSALMWWWNCQKCNRLGKLYQLCHLNNKCRYWNSM
jgi:hypothetical protein